MLLETIENTSQGIAVGMATSIPSHNLGDLYDAINILIDNALEGKETSIDEVISVVKAPDFPTGGYIMGLKEIHEGYRTGKGRVIMRAKYEIEEHKGRNSIVVTEIPYQVNKAKLIEKIAYLIKDKVIEGIAEIRDESDKDGMRIVAELKRDANVQYVVNKLFKHTDLQCSFGMNMIAIVDGEPKKLNLLEMFELFLAHAAEVITRRTEYDFTKSKTRLNIVEGILRCGADEELFNRVVDTMKNADDPVSVFINELGFNHPQAEYIDDAKLRTLVSKSSIEKLTREQDQLKGDIEKYTAILNDEAVLLNTMKTEFDELKAKFADPRRSQILAEEGSIEESDLIKEEMLVVTLSSDGLVKSVEEKEYKTQNRGGKGVKVANTKEEEVIRFMLTVNSKEDVLFFTNQGRCHVLKAYKIAKSSRTARGKSINNYLSLNPEEIVVSMITANVTEKENSLLFLTEQGIIKRLSFEDLSTRLSVTRVIGFKEGDALKCVIVVKPEDNVLIATALGQGIRIAMNQEGVKQIRPMGRTAAGVIGIALEEGDEVVDMCVVDDTMTLLTVTENGLGKRTKADQWTVQGRGGKGIITHKINERTGRVVSATTVTEEDELFVATEQGLITRVDVKNISTFGRGTSGVKIMNINEGDKVVSISKGEQD